MVWLPPENKLDAQQRDFINNVDLSGRNVWIKGFAGSGKSVLLAYTARKILLQSPSSEILLIVFTRSLVDMFTAVFKEIDLHISIDTYYGFMRSRSHYDYILCDEVQDLTATVLREMRARCEHLVVAGDSNQSIYPCDPKWRERTLEPHEISSIINGREFDLNVIHRLSKSIIDAVQRFLPGMNIFSAKRDMTRHDTQIRLCEASSEKQEVDYIMEQAKKAVSCRSSAAILIPNKYGILSFVNSVLENKGKKTWEVQLNQYNNWDYGALNRYLSQCGVKMQYIGNGYGKFMENDDRVTLMTYHSAKGLDFDNVFIPFANSSLFIKPDEELAKTIFMVAMTRAKENLYISYCGYPSDYLDAFKNNCAKIDISEDIAGNNNVNNQSGNSNSNNVWGF